MAVAEETEPGQTGHRAELLRATCLLGVLVLAKLLTLAGRGLSLSFWTPFAYFWQDILVAVVFFMLDVLLRRPALGWSLYGVTVAYVALNVPVTLVLSTPLTWTIIRAARGPLADSIAYSFTFANVRGLLLVAGASVLLPWVLGRWTIRARLTVAATATAFVTIGPVAVSRIDTRGLHRNAIGALLSTSVPRLSVVRADADWRASPFGPSTTLRAGPSTALRASGGIGQDLSSLRGAATGRNVVLVILESTAARYLGLYGAARDPMPNLTALAREAVVFDGAYAVYPESIKGLFSTLCSRYPAFDTPPEIHARVPCASLAATLAQAGYRTALFHSGRFDYLGMASIVDDRGFNVLEDAGAIGGNTTSSFGVDEPFTVRRMLEWIDSLENDKRFFVTYLPIAGHHPYVSPEPRAFEPTSESARYLNALHYSDEALGDLVRGLAARHLDDRTLIVVVGDHGEAFGQHPGNSAHSLFIYDENVRVPFVIVAPGTIRDHTRVTRVASLIDTAPTILDLLGLTLPAGYQGASLLGPESRMALFYTDYSLGWLGLRDSCWKYLYEIDAGRSKLFDICADPEETQDHSTTFQDRVYLYRNHLQRWAAAQKHAVTHGR